MMFRILGKLPLGSGGRGGFMTKVIDLMEIVHLYGDTRSSDELSDTHVA
jgi:hypothetical protein